MLDNLAVNTLVQIGNGKLNVEKNKEVILDHLDGKSDGKSIDEKGFDEFIASGSTLIKFSGLSDDEKKAAEAGLKLLKESKEKLIPPKPENVKPVNGLPGQFRNSLQTKYPELISNKDRIYALKDGESIKIKTEKGELTLIRHGDDIKYQDSTWNDKTFGSLFNTSDHGFAQIDKTFHSVTERFWNKRELLFSIKLKDNSIIVIDRNGKPLKKNEKGLFVGEKGLYRVDNKGVIEEVDE